MSDLKVLEGGRKSRQLERQKRTLKVAVIIGLVVFAAVETVAIDYSLLDKSARLADFFGGSVWALIFGLVATGLTYMFGRLFKP